MQADIWGLGKICQELLDVLTQKNLAAEKATTTGKHWEVMCALEEFASSMVQEEQDLRPNIQGVVAQITSLAQRYSQSE